MTPNAYRAALDAATVLRCRAGREERAGPLSKEKQRGDTRHRLERLVRLRCGWVAGNANGPLSPTLSSRGGEGDQCLGRCTRGGSRCRGIAPG